MSDGGVTRRRLLAGAGAAGAGVGLGVGGYLVGRDSADAAETETETVPFYGPHQAGISTAVQERLQFAAFDFIGERVADLRHLLREWTVAAVRMTAGKPIGPTGTDPPVPPVDTGEAVGLGPARLTLTFGFGPSLFEVDGQDRIGLRGKRPAALRRIPPFPGDDLDAKRSGGDLCIQACADDAQVAFHAIRDLTRIAHGVAAPRWSQLGFGRTSTTSRSQRTPRNLMGFKDGTENIRNEDPDALDRYVWVPASEPQAWMRGGSYVVTRRIEMLLDTWDSATLANQEKTIGREKTSGAPLGESSEFDPLDLNASRNGAPLIPFDAHVRLSHPSVNQDERILRRGFSFSEGVDAELSELEAGLFFICFQRDPARQFVAIQSRLASNDALNTYIRHTSSAVFAVPPGASSGGYVGEGLVAS
jgi:deferrochelatase/peroxidase EfeB